MSEPELFWVNATNVALGVITVGCWVVVLVTAALELRRRLRRGRL